MFEFLRDIYSILWVDLRNLSHHWRWTVTTSLIQPVLYLLAFGYGRQRRHRERRQLPHIRYPGDRGAYGFFIQLQRQSVKTSNRPPLLQQLRRIPDFTHQPVLNRRWQSAHRRISGLNKFRGDSDSGACPSPDLIVNPVFAFTLLLSCFVFFIVRRHGCFDV